MALSLIINVVAGFASPLGIKNLLQYVPYKPRLSEADAHPSYLETDGEDAVTKPWFWILWLFIGPYITATAYQYYIYVAVCAGYIL